MLNDHTDREPMTAGIAVTVLAALASVTVPIAGFTVFAQTRFATLSGTATDESGAVLANATVTLSNVGSHAKYEVRTDRSGAFELVGLTSGHYSFDARLLGFEPLKDQISIGVGETLQKNVVLKVHAVQETITVTGRPGGTSGSAANNRIVAASCLPECATPVLKACPDPAVGGCIGPPVKVRDVRPVYPPALQDTGIQGTVVIDGQIGTDGRMKDMRVVSSPHPAFESSALEAVGQWEFRPTTLNGRVIDTRINVNVSFAPEPTAPHSPQR